MSDLPALNPAVRNQLGVFHGSGPLQQAAKAWYDSLDEMEKRQVEATCQAISGTVRAMHPTLSFGLGSALELLAGLIAYEQGWLGEVDAHQASVLRIKYGRGKRKIQRRR